MKKVTHLSVSLTQFSELLDLAQVAKHEGSCNEAVFDDMQTQLRPTVMHMPEFTFGVVKLDEYNNLLVQVVFSDDSETFVPVVPQPGL